MILDGKAVAQSLLDPIAKSLKNLDSSHPRPHLTVILIGEDPSSLSYIRMKEKRAKEVGMVFSYLRYPVTITQGELEAEVRRISTDPSIHGLIIQAPLPAHIDRYAVTECIDPEKDVDGFTQTQIGNMFLGHDGLWCCTPKGIMTMLEYYDIPVRGRQVTIIGRSNIVGKPMALMMINAGATVTSCNSVTRDLSTHTRSADIVIVAVGRAGFLTREMIRPETIVIDVGSNLTERGFCGDADFDELSEYVQAISPSPGGVGPMTVATLIENTWLAYQRQEQK